MTSSTSPAGPGDLAEAYEPVDIAIVVEWYLCLNEQPSPDIFCNRDSRRYGATERGALRGFGNWH